jgi:hypothetical protein
MITKHLILAVALLSALGSQAMADDTGTIPTGPYQTCSVTHTCPTDPPLRPHVPTVPPVANYSYVSAGHQVTAGPAASHSTLRR